MNRTRGKVAKKCLSCKRNFYPFYGRIGKNLYCSHRCYEIHAGTEKMVRKRFWDQVDKNGPIPKHFSELGACWIWTGATTNGGYGIINIRKKLIRAHRWTWKYSGKPNAGKKFICHRCDNPPCVRPKHLFLGTQKENMHDCAVKGRTYKSKLKGENHWKSKLTEDSIKEIRESYIDGKTITELAKKFGVCQTNISAIVRRQTWKHI